MSTSPDIKSQFFRYLVARNRPHLDNIKQWLFHPGMRFNSWEKWWGNQGARSAPHEGLDLYSFEDSHGVIKTVDANLRIPAAFGGKIVKIDQDFLGKSIYISHEVFDDRGRQLYSAFGHTVPRDALQIGSIVTEGETIGVISAGSGQKTAIAPHLHITFAWIPVPLDIRDLNWDNLGNNPGITLIDPLSVLKFDSSG